MQISEMKSGCTFFENNSYLQEVCMDMDVMIFKIMIKFVIKKHTKIVNNWSIIFVILVPQHLLSTGEINNGYEKQIRDIPINIFVDKTNGD